jgi:hypothetical protein
MNESKTPLRDLIDQLQRSLAENGEPLAVFVRAIVPGDYNTTLWEKGHRYVIEGRVNPQLWRGDDVGEVGNGNDILYVIAEWAPWVDEQGREVG